MIEHAAQALEGDVPPSQPWQPQGPDETPAQEQGRLKADLDMGKEWSFFRDRRLDPPAVEDDDHGHDAT